MQYPGARHFPSVSTILTPAERMRVDAAGEGTYRAIHRDVLQDAYADVRAKRSSTVLLSVARCDAPMQSTVCAMVREYPQVSTVAFVSPATQNPSRAALTLGSSGITQLVDVREPTGWHDLRDLLLLDRSTQVHREALAQLAIDLAGVQPECWRFFEALFTESTQRVTIRFLAREFGLLPSTLMSRFYRAGLPAPKRYLATARLIRAARLFENPGFSISNVANHLDYSSSQSFGRHVRTLLDLTAGEFREQFDGAGMLAHFRATLVIPHLTALRALRPLGDQAVAAEGPGTRRRRWVKLAAVHESR